MTAKAKQKRRTAARGRLRALVVSANKVLEDYETIIGELVATELPLDMPEEEKAHLLRALAARQADAAALRDALLPYTIILAAAARGDGGRS